VIAEVARDHPEAERLEVWFLDEARVGQTGRVCRRWFEKGIRPRGVRDLRHQAVYLFGAVCPARAAGVALVLPAVGAAAMPAYSPELNAIERVWLYLRERFLSHRLWPSYDDILDACCAAWNALLNEPGRIRSLCTLDCAAPVSS
jgi:DDE superfamily endonuclease